MTGLSFGRKREEVPQEVGELYSRSPGPFKDIERPQKAKVFLGEWCTQAIWVKMKMVILPCG